MDAKDGIELGTTPEMNGISLLVRPVALAVFLWVLLFPTIGARSSPEAPPVRIGGSHWIGDAPTKIADALDYFNKGMPSSAPRIEVTYLESGKDALGAVLAGELDFALVATTPLAIAISDGNELSREPVILASVALSNQSHLVLGTRDEEILEPSDLEGKRVGMPRGTSAEFAWSRFVSLHELDPRTMEIQDLPVGSLAAALEDRSIDAAVLWDPLAATLRDRLGDRITIFSTRSLHTVNWLLVADRSLVREEPEVADRVVGGFLRAVDLIHRNRDRARELHAKMADRSPQQLAELEERVIWTVALDWSILTNMNAQLDWLCSGGEEGTDSIPPPARYLEPSALSRLAPERVHLPPYLYRHPDSGHGSSP